MRILFPLFILGTFANDANAFEKNLLNFNQIINGSKNSCEAIDANKIQNPVCNLNYKQFCSMKATAPKLTTKALIKRVGKSTVADPDSIDSNDAEDGLIYDKKLLNAIYNDGAKTGITPTTIVQLVDRIKEEAIRQLTVAPGYSEELSKDVKFQDTLIEKIRKIKLVTAQNSDLDFSDFANTCGTDGLESNASYSDDDNTLTVCSGIILSSVQRRDPSLLYFILGHEIGHSFDVSIQEWHKKGEKNKLLNFENFLPYLSCVKKFDSAWFSDNTVYSKRFDVLDAAVKTCLDDAKKNKSYPQAEMDALERYYDLGHGSAFGIAMTQMQTFGEDPVFTHGSELTADLMGKKSLELYLRTLPNAKRISTVKDALRFFCAPDVPSEGYTVFHRDCAKSLSSEQIKLVDMDRSLEDDGLHPRDDYRLMAILQSTGIRDALGCAPEPSNRVIHDCNDSKNPENDEVGQSLESNVLKHYDVSK